MLPVAIGVTAPLAGRVAGRLGARRLMSAGMFLCGIGALEIALVHGHPGLVTGLALTGIGLGAFTPSNNASVMAAAPGGHEGVVSGLLNMTRGAGTALGVAVAGLLYAEATGVSGHEAASAGAAAAGRGLTVAMAALGGIGLVVGFWLWRSSRGYVPGRTKPASIFPISIFPVPVVTAGSPAANDLSSSSSSASTTPRPHEPVRSSTGPNATIRPKSINGFQ